VTPELFISRESFHAFLHLPPSHCLSRLSDHIHQRGFAALHNFQRPADGRP
jgi:hypothetical protein